jgi:nicotinamidase-related amidase
MAQASLASLVVQHKQVVDGHQALLVFGLQNDVIGPDARVPLSLDSGWLERIKRLVPEFREKAGDIFFVRSEVSTEEFKELDNTKVILDSSDTDGAPENENSAESPKDDTSPNKTKKKKRKGRNRVTQFLKDMGKKDQASITHVPTGQAVEDIFRNHGANGPCCVPKSVGAAFRSDIEALIEPNTDTVVVKRNFSAFSGTDLLVTLRMKIITDLYLVGCMTNLSIFATAQEAASHGLILNIVDDCLGYKTQKRHDIALKTMVEHMGAYRTTSSAMLAVFEGSGSEGKGTETRTSAEDSNDIHALSAAVGELDLEGKDRASLQSQDTSVTESAEPFAASGLSASNRASLNLPTRSKPTPHPPTTNSSAEPHSPSSSKHLRSFKSTPEIRNRGNVRVRVRKRNEAELPNVPGLPKAALHAKTLSREDDRAKMIQSMLDSQNNKEKENVPQNGEGTR